MGGTKTAQDIKQVLFTLKQFYLRSGTEFS